MERFLVCTRVYAFLPFLTVLFVFGAIVQVVALIRMSQTATRRDSGEFVCHRSPPTAQFIERRFDLAEDAPELAPGSMKSTGASQDANARVCAGRIMRLQVRAAGPKAGMGVSDDGKMF